MKTKTIGAATSIEHLFDEHGNRLFLVLLTQKEKEFVDRMLSMVGWFGERKSEYKKAMKMKMKTETKTEHKKKRSTKRKIKRIRTRAPRNGQPITIREAIRRVLRSSRIALDSIEILKKIQNERSNVKMPSLTSILSHNPEFVRTRDKKKWRYIARRA